jgi:bla regulator protein BlaR1
VTPWVLNHLWQSTVVTAVAALLALALRALPARVRFWVWTAASLKFLVPLALLATLGNHLAWRPPTSLPEPQTWRAVAQPFVASDAPAAVPATLATHPSPLPVGPAVLGVIWLAGSVTVLAVWLTRWARLLRVVLAAQPGPSVSASLPMRWTSATIEPGVFGLFRPVLLLPVGIAHRLSAEQLEALVAHELCHARRRDNLCALLHMLVEAAFWFVPPVWWIGNRLIAERERACDEAVLAQGADPGEYGDAVVQVCRYYAGAPLPCVSGVTGSDLKRRIADIVNYAGHRSLTWTAKLGMAALLLAVIAAPVAAGRLYAPWQERSELPAPKLSFDVASVKVRPAAPAAGMIGVSTPSPGRLVANCASLRALVFYAYVRDDHRYQDVLGGPAWTNSPCGENTGTFSIEATMPPATTATQSHEMMRSLLAARFKLQVHVETRQEKVFALIVAPEGLKLKPSDPKDDPPTPPHSLSCPADDLNCHMLSPGSWDFDSIANMESRYVGRPIVNKTGLSGHYFITDYHWRGDDAENSSLPTLPELFKRWGLELRSEMGPVDYLVIDHAEMPSGN